METKIIIFWVLLAAFILPSLIFGYQKLAGEKKKVEQFKRFGYPLWFMRMLGLSEIIACALLLFNNARDYGIAVFAVIFSGAIFTHLKQRDPNKKLWPRFL